MKHYLEIREDFFKDVLGELDEYLLTSKRKDIEDLEKEEGEFIEDVSYLEYDYTYGMELMEKANLSAERSGCFIMSGEIFFNCATASIEFDNLLMGGEDLGYEAILLENTWYASSGVFKFGSKKTARRILEFLSGDTVYDIPAYFDAKKKHSKDGWVLLELGI